MIDTIYSNSKAVLKNKVAFFITQNNFKEKLKMEKTKLSERATKWLEKHHLLNKVQNLKEYSNRLEFTEPSKRKGFLELNTVYLYNGSWETHTIHKSALNKWFW